jgi:hypothetical protein
MLRRLGHASAQFPDSPDGNQQRHAKTTAQQDIGFHFKVLKAKGCRVTLDARRRFAPSARFYLCFLSESITGSRCAKWAHAEIFLLSMP